jgi:hypothetical protein
MENALVGEFSAVLTSKVLNLDNQEKESGAIKVEIIQGTPELANSETEVLEKIKMEMDKRRIDEKAKGENSKGK